MARGKNPRSFTSCFFILVGVCVVVITILLVSMDYIKDKLELEEPESKIGSYIDQNIPHIEGVHQQRRMKAQLQKTQHMLAVKKAFASFYIFNDRMPSSLEELVRSRQIDRGALNDLWGQRHYLIFAERDAYLSTAGPDRIHNTQDDIGMSMMDPGIELSEGEEQGMSALVIDHVLSGRANQPAKR